MSEPRIPEYLKTSCPQCKGSGRVLYRDIDESYEGTCSLCKGRGWEFKLSLREMGERIAALDEERDALKVENALLDDLNAEMSSAAGIQAIVDNYESMRKENKTLKAQLAEADFDFGGWRAIKARLEKELEDAQREKHKIRAMLTENENLAFRYKQQVERLLIAAQAVIDRWMTPSWKDVGPTAQVINALANAVSAARKESK